MSALLLAAAGYFVSILSRSFVRSFIGCVHGRFGQPSIPPTRFWTMGPLESPIMCGLLETVMRHVIRIELHRSYMIERQPENIALRIFQLQIRIIKGSQAGKSHPLHQRFLCCLYFFILPDSSANSIFSSTTSRNFSRYACMAHSQKKSNRHVQHFLKFNWRFNLRWKMNDLILVTCVMCIHYTRTHTGVCVCSPVIIKHHQGFCFCFSSISLFYFSLSLSLLDYRTVTNWGGRERATAERRQCVTMMTLYSL